MLTAKRIDFRMKDSLNSAPAWRNFYMLLVDQDPVAQTKAKEAFFQEQPALFLQPFIQGFLTTLQPCCFVSCFRGVSNLFQGHEQGRGCFNWLRTNNNEDVQRHQMYLELLHNIILYLFDFHEVASKSCFFLDPLKNLGTSSTSRWSLLS